MQLKQSIAQNVIWRGLYLSSVFALNVLMSRFFKADTSGLIFYIINNLSFLLLVVGLCLETGAGFYLASGSIPPKPVAVFCLIWSLISAACCFGVISISASLGHETVFPKNEIIAGSTAYSLGVLLTTYFSALFFAKKNFFIPNFVLIIITSLLMLTLLLFHQNHFLQQHFISLYFFSFLFQGILLCILFLSRTGAGQKSVVLSRSDLKKIVRYSLLALLTNIVFFIVYRGDYWFVGIFCNQPELGNYIQVSKLGQIFLLLPAMMAAAIFPQTAGGSDEQGMKTSLQALSRNLLAFYLLLVIVLLAAGKWIFPHLYGPTFNHMYIPFVLLTPGILSLSALSLVTAWHAGKNRVMVNLKGALLALCIIVPADWLLVPRYGIKAAAAVSSIGYLAYLFYVIFVFRREYHVKARDFFVFRRSDISWLRNLSKDFFQSFK